MKRMGMQMYAVYNGNSWRLMGTAIQKKETGFKPEKIYLETHHELQIGELPSWKHVSIFLGAATGKSPTMFDSITRG